MRDLNVTSLPVFRNVIACLLPSLAIGLVCGGIDGDRATYAQHAQPPSSGGPRPAGMGGPGMGGPGGVGPQRPIPGQFDPNAVKGPIQELKIDPVKLPDNFSPPAVKDATIELDRTFVFQDELDKSKKDIGKYQNALRAARMSDADKALIRQGLRYRLGLMCLKENRQQLSKIHEDLLKDLNMAGSAPDLKPSTIKEFRQFVLQELLTMTTPLLSNQNFYVRLHLAILIGELNLTEENQKANLKLEAFSPGLDTLVQVISDEKQPEAVKVVAVNGIVRLLRLGVPQFDMRTRVAQALVDELKRSNSHPWYQMRLSGALASVDVNMDQARKPFVVDVLKAVLADETRKMPVRAEAAKSLGRVPLPASVAAPTITRAVAEFALSLAKAAQQSPQSKADDPKWKSEFIKVYLAFQPLDANDLMADKKSKAGLLNNNQAAAKPAYDLIVPLVAAILHGQRLTVQQVQTLQAYVNPAAPAQTESKPKPAATESKVNGAASPMQTVEK